MRMHACGCPALLGDGSIDFGPRVVGEFGVWDFPCVSFARDDTPLPLYQHGAQLDYRANKYSMQCGCMGRNWRAFKKNLPTLPALPDFVPKPNDFRFIRGMLQYRPGPERELASLRMHMKAGPLLGPRSQLPIPADMLYTYRPPIAGPLDQRRSKDRAC